MFRFKRFLVLSGVVGLLAAMAFAAPSQAVKAVCAVTGTAKTEDKENPDIGVRLVGGKGTFEFRNGALVLQCDEIGKAVGVQTVRVTASGWYDNVVCGSGKSVGTVTAVDNQKYAALVGDRFAFEAAALFVTFYWEATEVHPDKRYPDLKVDPVLNDDPSPGKDADDDWAFAGDLELLEKNTLAGTNKAASRPPDPFTGHCVDGFDVVGWILVHPA